MIVQLEEEKALLIAGMVDKTCEHEAYKDILAWCKKVKTNRKDWDLPAPSRREVTALKTQ